MYCKMTLKNGATLTELANDLKGLLTGAVVSAASLTSVDVAATELVIKEAATWTFVQALADTATRKHFVFEGVDDGGIPKTMGLILTDVSGTLNYNSWTCGAWDPVAKRPAPIDVTGFAVSDQFGASAFGADSNSNTVLFTAGTSSTASTINGLFSSGPISTGEMQLQVSSIQGMTCIYAHYGTTHQQLIRMYDVPRAELGAWATPENWPFPLVASFYSYNVSLPGPVNLTTSDSSKTARGITFARGVGNAYGSFTEPLSSEFGMPGGWNPYTTTSARAIRWAFDLVGTSVYSTTSKADNTVTERGWLESSIGLVLSGVDVYSSTVKPIIKLPKVAPAYVSPENAHTSSVLLSYLDELVVGDETYVSPGITSQHQFSLYKG